MTTLFDIGDTITLTLTGTVKSFSASKDGDCYVVNLKDEKQEELPLYFDTKSLLLSNAKKVEIIREVVQ